MFNLISTRGKPAYGIKEFVVDLESEIPSINVADCQSGSIVFVIENSKYFMLNGSKQWVSVELSSGGGGGSDTEEVIYNGGLV